MEECRMRVLVACEESQRVCQAFRDRGHEAYSCDLNPTTGSHPEWHIQGDVLSVLIRDTVQSHLHGNQGSEWDLMIAHPPCTYLCNSGVRWLYNSDGSINQERWKQMKIAAGFFRHLWCADIDKICIENPVMHKHGKYEAGVAYAHDMPEFKQVVHPWWFGNYGENESKATCLWRRNLPPLKKVNPLPAPHNQSVHKMAPSQTRSRDRAVTFFGLAEAMADQWGCL